MQIWKDSLVLSDYLFDLADKAEEKRFFKFAEQQRAATMSITNNIAGSGSSSDKDFASFLNISHRSIFECANITYIFERRNIISTEYRKSIFKDLVVLSKKVSNFRKSLI